MQYRFVLSQLQQSADQAEAAAKTLQSIVDQAVSSEDRHRAMGQLAVYELKADKKAEAMARVGEILAEDPRNEQALIIKATQLIDERELDKAISDLRTSLRDSPGSARALLLLGNAHEVSGAMELADDLYSRAFQASRQSADFGLAYARFLLKLQRAQRAAAVLEDGLHSKPDHLASLTLLAQIRVATGDWAGAQEAADRIRQLEDTDSVSQQIMGAVYAGQQNYEQSINAFKEAYEASSSAMVSLVRAYVRAGQADEAVSFLNAVVTASDDNNNARLLLGRLYESQGENDKAAEVFREVIKREPSLTEGYRSLASLETRLDKPTEALQVLDAGLEEVPGDFGLRMLKAGVYEAQQDYEAAIEIYDELLLERPNADVVANNLASLLSDHRDDEASLKRAHELAGRFRSSKIPYFKDTLGWTYYRLGNAEDAIELIEDATQEMPSSPVFRYHLGMAYVAIDEKESARQEFEKALELAGDSPFTFRDKVTEAIKEL
jgi:tetratricopeptide (TPR) repeat protein